MTGPGEIERALNALATTLGDQRPPRAEEARLQQIVDGALGGERKLSVRVLDASRAAVSDIESGSTLADIALVDGRWEVTRS